MSEELTTSSTKSQDSTQTGSITLPDFNPCPENGPVFYGLNVEQTVELVEKGVINPVMTGQEFEFKGVMVTRPDWIHVNGYRELKYYEDGGKLVIKCRGSSIETCWGQMVAFSQLSLDDFKLARDKFMLESRIPRNTNSVSAMRMFVEAIQRELLVPPGGKVAAAEKPAETLPGQKVHWTFVPKHPQLKYREESGHLILNYAGSVVTTTWEEIEKTSRVEPRFWKYNIEKIVGNRPTRGRKDAVGLFMKLVESGKVSRVVISQFVSDDSTGVSV